MGILSRIFDPNPSAEQPDIHFGRFSGKTKTDTRYDEWDKAVEKFEAQSYCTSVCHILEYLTNEPEKNVQYDCKDETVSFQLLQGSKKITGYADQVQIRAIAKIARVAGSPEIGFMRRLLESNYQLKYGRYCLDDEGDIAIMFDSNLADASPYKVFYGLKEIALAADKHDDLLVEEFSGLSPINVGHIIPLPANLRAVKLAYIQETLQGTLHEIDHGKLNPIQYPGGITYLLLNAIYKLDFLVRPEGQTMETIERMHRFYFENSGLNNVQKNHRLIKELKLLLSRPSDKIESEMYRTTSTFSVVSTANHPKLRDIIQGEIHNMDWYFEKRHFSVALAIPGYIVGHALFSFGLPDLDKSLLLLYYQIVEHEYFRDLGFKYPYLSADGKLDQRSIMKAIAAIKDAHLDAHPFLVPNTKLLIFDHMVLFAKSYLIMISNLNLSKTP
ncbi:MAG: hypothetical protein HKN87_09765 [Saprospiraceae bacterium]|nr:hypothetical protein [Saprospiraceae bacterium]